MGYTEHLMSALGEEAITERINSFFPEVLGRLGLTAEQASAHCEVRVRELPIHEPNEEEPLRPSDDRITELWVQERAVATIVELRDGFNFAQILLADYLSQELSDQLHRVMVNTEADPTP